MATKKQTETEPSAPPTMIKKKYLNPAQCRETAARISQEIRDYPEHLRLWNRSTPHHCLAPVVPLWGPNHDTAAKKIGHLYHEDEAAVIIAALTP